MNCENIKDLFADYLTGEMNPEDLPAFSAHLASCSACSQELESLNETWIRLGILAEEKPSPRLRQRFYAMLEQASLERRDATRKDRLSWIRGLFSGWRLPTPQLQLASLLLVVAAFAAGYLIRPGTSREAAELRQDVNSMREILAVSLLDRPSAGDRLQGISYSMQLDQAGSTTVGKLLDIVDNDPSINVRLAAIDSLYLYGGEAGVRERLVESLRQQSSPMVQVALVDLLGSWKEEKAARALKQLITEGKLHPAAAERAKTNFGLGL